MSYVSLILNILKCVVWGCDWFDKGWTVRDTSDNRIIFPWDLPIYSCHFKCIYILRLLDFEFSNSSTTHTHTHTNNFNHLSFVNFLKIILHPHKVQDCLTYLLYASSLAHYCDVLICDVLICDVLICSNILT